MTIAHAAVVLGGEHGKAHEGERKQLIMQNEAQKYVVIFLVFFRFVYFSFVFGE